MSDTDVFISDTISAYAIMDKGVRVQVKGMVVDITPEDGLIIIEDFEGDLLGIKPEDVIEVLDRDADIGDREDNFRDDAEADADALASAGMGTDEDYEHPGMDDGDDY